MILKNENNLGKIITALYFIVASIEVTAELYSYKPILFIFKPSLSILLVLLYWNSSKKKNPLFFATLFFSLITNILFIPNTEKLLFLALIAFLIHRLLMIFYIFTLIKIKDYIPLAISMMPFLFIFFYLLSQTNDLSANSYYIIIIQNILMAIIAGITLSDYAMNNHKKNLWLLLFGLFSVVQYFIVFIEKYYLSDLSPIIFRPLAMLLNVVVYYSFYKFVIDCEHVVAAERLNND